MQTERLYYSTDDVQRAHERKGGHWFDPGSMRFFKSRVGSEVYYIGGRYFFTSSEKGPDDVRRYSVREATAEGDVKTVGKFQGYSTAAAAVRAIKSGAVLEGRAV
jgi:hypothetical protein